MAKNIGGLDEKVVMDRLRKLFEASEASGAAEAHWYQTAHDQIVQLAAEHKIDPYTLASHGGSHLAADDVAT